MANGLPTKIFTSLDIDQILSMRDSVAFIICFMELVCL